MGARILESLVPLLVLAFSASALFRVVRMFLPGPSFGLWSLPKGPSVVLVFLEVLSTLFLLIPMTLIWGLFLACVIATCHFKSLWRMSHSV